jgi:hypothetical protein
MAAVQPTRIATLTTIGGRLIGGKPPYDGKINEVQLEVERDGVEAWARRTMHWRMGSAAPEELVEGWVSVMSPTPLSTLRGFLRDIPNANFTGDLLHILSPTLVIVTEGSGPGDVAAARAAQSAIPRSELVVLKGDSQHAAATDADACASAVLDFIARHPYR